MRLNSAFLCLLIAGPAAFARAASSDDAYARGLNADAAAVAAATPVVRTIASNNSNAPDLYARLAAQGNVPTCQHVHVAGADAPLKACRVAGRLDHFTVHINDLLWWYSYPVDPIGDTACRQEWIAQTNSHGAPERPQLWYFCRFTFVPKN